MKTAVLFPGVGYHCDKPLLYFSKRLAREAGFRIIEIRYPDFHIEGNIRGDKEKLRGLFGMAVDAAEQQLCCEGLLTGGGQPGGGRAAGADSEAALPDEILLIGKSIGTVVACALSKKWRLPAKHIVFTPVEETFQFLSEGAGLVFHGTADPWVETALVRRECNRLKLPLFITDDANHSLETTSAERDIANLAAVMRTVREYIESPAAVTFQESGRLR